MKSFVIVLGIFFALVGFIVGNRTLHVTQNGETVSCGAPWRWLSNIDAGMAEGKDQDNNMRVTFGGVGERTTFSDTCESKRETYGILGGVGTVVGGGLLLAGLFIPGIPRRRTTAK